MINLIKFTTEIKHIVSFWSDDGDIRNLQTYCWNMENFHISSGCEHSMGCYTVIPEISEVQEMTAWRQLKFNVCSVVYLLAIQVKVKKFVLSFSIFDNYGNLHSSNSPC